MQGVGKSLKIEIIKKEIIGELASQPSPKKKRWGKKLILVKQRTKLSPIPFSFAMQEWEDPNYLCMQ